MVLFELLIVMETIDRCSSLLFMQVIAFSDKEINTPTFTRFRELYNRLLNYFLGVPS